MKINRCFSCAQEIERYPCSHCGFDPSGYQQPGYALPLGTVLNGRYLVGKVLGRGGFGITYVGWDLVLQYKCAIKEFYPSGHAIRDCTMGVSLHWSDGEQAENLRRTGLDSFLKEARKMYKVDHVPGVVRVRDTFIENETAYIIMDYVGGETLKTRLMQKGVLSWEEAKSVFYPVIATMEQVHQAGLVHRDISPDNLMLLPDGSVSILDLGAAKDLNANSGASSMQVIKGGFSPLEQYGQRGGSGPWTDVYAMAATMYYALTGMLPPPAVDRLPTDSMNWDHPELKQLPKPVLEALKKAIAVMATDRTQSMAQLLAQLRAGDKKKRKPKPPKPVKVKGPKPPKPPKPPKEPKPPKPPKPPKLPKPEKVKKEKVQKERRPIPKSVRVLAAVLAVALLGGAVLWQRPAPNQEPQLAATEETASPAEETTGKEHVHDWAPATVGSPARCTSCGIMTGTSLGNTICAGVFGVYSVQEDGTVAAFSYFEGQLEEYEKELDEQERVQLAQWENVDSLVFGPTLWGAEKLYGVQEDGLVLSLEEDDPAGNWADVAKFGSPGVAVRKDGTVLKDSMGYKDWAHIAAWRDMVDVIGSDLGVRLNPLSQATNHIQYMVGLRSDGTLVFDSEYDLFPEAKGWTDIVCVAADDALLLGLKADGTVVYTLAEEYSFPEASGGYVLYEDDLNLSPLNDWTNIVQIDTRFGTVVGLRSDGTVVTNFPGAETLDWTDMVSIDLYRGSIYGLKSGGTVLGWHAPSWYDRAADWGDVSAMPDVLLENIKIPQAKAPEQVHIHTWQEATVGSPARCTDCGLMVGTSLDVTLDGDPAAAVREDGHLIIDELNDKQAKNVAKWENIASVALGNNRLYGVTEDGAVLAAEYNWNNPCETWTNVAKLGAGTYHAAALRADGTVVSGDYTYVIPLDNSDHLKTEDWWRMVDVTAGLGTEPYTVGLRSDGTLEFAAVPELPFDEAKSWTDIVSVDSSYGLLLGLRADGTVAFTTVDPYGPHPELDSLAQWEDIVQIDCCMYGDPFVETTYYVAGLKSDGTVVTNHPEMDVSGWTDIVTVVITDGAVYGLRSDGVLVVAGGTMPNGGPWTGIRVPKPEFVPEPADSEAPPEEAHTHTWAEATVGSPACCTDCGLMTGTAVQPTIEASGYDNFCIKNDGTIIYRTYGTTRQGGDGILWKNPDIISIGRRTGPIGMNDWSDALALRQDGTLENDVLVNHFLSDWSDLAAVNLGEVHVAGLRRDGTVVTAPFFNWVTEERDEKEAVDTLRKLGTDSWTDIVDVEAATFPCTIGLKADGTLVFAADREIFPEAKAWTDIVDICEYDGLLLGLKADGTVVTACDGDVYMPPESIARIEDWTNIIQIDCGGSAAGLRADGTVVTEMASGVGAWEGCQENWTGREESWTGIIAISAGNESVMGLKADGTTVNVYWDYRKEEFTGYSPQWKYVKIPVAMSDPR